MSTLFHTVHRYTPYNACSPTTTPETCIRNELVTPPVPLRPSSAYAKVHMRTYNCVHLYTNKLKHSRTLIRCTVQIVHAELCTSTNTHIHYARRSGCSCRTLCNFKYSVHVHVHAPTYNRCIAQTTHVKHCTRTRTVCTSNHTGLGTIGASLRLPMPNNVHVHVQGAHPSTRVYVQ